MTATASFFKSGSYQCLICGQKDCEGCLMGSAQEPQARSPEEVKSAVTIAALLNHLESAWLLLANAGGGDWTKETQDWFMAAVEWRDKYFWLLNEVRKSPDPSLMTIAPATEFRATDV